MLPERPELPERPCPVCGQAVDVLRAPQVLWLDDGARFLCGSACRTRFLEGDHAFDRPSERLPRSEPVERPSIPDLVRDATLARRQPESAELEAPTERPHDALVATGLAALALGFAVWAPSRDIGWLAAFLVALCAAVNARAVLALPSTSRWPYLLAPAGLALAALGAVGAQSAEAQRWSLLGAAVAAIAVSTRRYVHASTLATVKTLARKLLDTLPSTARIPGANAASYEEVPSAELRQGELAVVLEGERAPADGEVEEGNAVGLRYPEAAHSTPYGEGDFILAGTRILEGAITIRVRRTGDERGVARAVGIGSRQPLDRTWLARSRILVARVGWVLVGVGALLLLVSAGPQTAATLLLGVPLLAAIGSFEVPLEAGALAAARRGMFFGSSRALRDASRVGTTAVLLRGALTAGEPVVRQVKTLGTLKAARAIALAAAAEGAAGDHPIARAMRRYSEQAGYRRAAVRKERAIAGLGVTAVTARGAPVVVGRRQLLLDEGISVAGADEDAAHIENEGLTPIFIAVDGVLEALVTVLDPTHVGAPDAIRRIEDLPCEVVILSGDDRRTVERIATNLGASRVKAPLLPRERIDEVRALRETGGITAAVGRGGEDDSVLAAADVPISLRLVGSALEDRGVVVASRDVRDAAGALWIARAVRRSTWRSLGACAVVTVLVVAGASTAWMTPAVAAVLALATDTWALRTGSRLLRRVDLRVPVRQ